MVKDHIIVAVIVIVVGFAFWRLVTGKYIDDMRRGQEIRRERNGRPNLPFVLSILAIVAIVVLLIIIR